MEETIEKDLWDGYFAEALDDKGQEVETLPFWNHLDAALSDEVRLGLKEPASVLEAGCGAGGSSYKLSQVLSTNRLALLDISDKALDFARTLENTGKAKKTDFFEGSVFDLSAFYNEFDLVWNVGLIEHYPKEQIRKIAIEMYRAVKPGGKLFIGMPNKLSIAVLKAALLGSSWARKYLKGISGYRNSTENLYGAEEIQSLLAESLEREVQLSYVGCPLNVGAPSFMVEPTAQLKWARFFRFLVCFTIKKVGVDDDFSDRVL